MKPLEGIVVLDFTQFTSGPFLTVTLADLGAEIIRLENPPFGDNNYYNAPSINKKNSYTASLDHNKKSVLMNMKNEAHKALFYEMVKTADLVIDNFKAGTMKKFGADYETLKKINPRIVCASISGYGQDGPWASRAAYDIVVQAVGGFISLTGEPGGRPLKVGFSLADTISGATCTGPVIAALYQARRTGQGCSIDFSMMDCAVSMFPKQLAEFSLTGENPKLMGNQHPTMVPCGTFPCRDGLVMLCIHDDTEFAQLCTLLGNPELAQEAAYAAAEARLANRDAIHAAIAALTALQEKETLCRAAAAAGLSCVPVQTIPEASTMEQLKQRQMTTPYAQWPDGTKVRTVGCPIHISGMQTEDRYTGPSIGEDTIAVMSRYAPVEQLHTVFDETLADSQIKVAEKRAKMK